MPAGRGVGVVIEACEFRCNLITRERKERSGSDLQKSNYRLFTAMSMHNTNTCGKITRDVMPPFQGSVLMGRDPGVGTPGYGMSPFQGCFTTIYAMEPNLQRPGKLSGFPKP
ncbi:hypothetical protein CYPRO_1745 [Cyclonatronum proteinivorum]|uniref:Uncharacterized protein n=1 Tax=Cyclonatronum proteinivorum TaxID=1457365 RepID=A0A345UKJ3_9BACT|nr:hypothetical protein CYPRO_1745 [Cyclonatronum proteinivorum]